MPLSQLRVQAAFIRARCKTNAERCFCFLPFLTKVKILFGFILVTKTGTNVGLSKKVKGHKQTFEKQRIPVFL